MASAKTAVPEAEKLFADAVGARQAVFTTCGSSISIHTVMLTVTGPGRHPEISAALIITPTGYGTGADVRGIADICHEHGIPLLVDEAWGAHFPFHPDLPTAAARAGADIVVQSLHKADGGLCQSSVITTTSESALMYGSIDGFRRRMVQEGRHLLTEALHRADGLRNRLDAVAGLQVMNSSIIGPDAVVEWGPLKLSVDISTLGITGYQAREWLQSEHRLTTQLGDARRVVCSLTYADDDAIERLATLEALAADPPTPDRPAPDVHRWTNSISNRS